MDQNNKTFGKHYGLKRNKKKTKYQNKTLDKY